MYNNSLLRSIIVIGIIATLFASCDKDYDELGTDIVGENHYGVKEYSGATVKAFNQDLGAISSNNLAVNPLGFFEDPAFGNTHANFVTQVVMASVNPTFNNTTVGEFVDPPTVDSVIVEIPYFCALKETASDGKKTYELDSIYGQEGSKFKLNLYQSNYYLRDFDPDQSFAAAQLFYTSQDGVINANKIGAPLNYKVYDDGHENEYFYFDKREHKTTTYEDDGVTPIYTRTPPSMRLHLNETVFKDLIINAPTGQLASNETFKSYFRGLYFKTESQGNPASMAMMNFAKGTITMYYKEDKKVVTTTTTGSTTTFQRVSKTFVLNLTGNTVSLLNNTRSANYAAAMSNTSQEAEKLYIKGGEGSMAVINIFGDPSDANYDLYKYVPKIVNGQTVVDGFGNTIYIKEFTPNGVSDELDELRYPEIAEGSTDHSKKNQWLINEANLTFYVNQDIATGMGNSNQREPNRIYLYDLKNKKILADYTQDFTTNSSYPKYGKYLFGGIAQNQDGSITKVQNVGQHAYKYKIRITNHVRNLISKDSTNVKLGLVVTENINGSTSFSKRQNPGTDAVISAPSMSVMSPLGTILYGSSPAVDDKQRLKLQIYYTKPN